jgi:putative membrane protein
MYSTRTVRWLAWAGGVLTIALAPLCGWTQNTSAAEPGTSASGVGGAPVTSPNTYEGGLGRQSGNPLAAPGASTPMHVSPALTTDEKSFLREVSGADLFQMEAASLAMTKASSPRVKALAAAVLDSHARIRMWLEQISRERAITLPSQPDTGHAARLAALRQASGPAFDREYTHAALEENRRDVQRFEQAAADVGEDRQIRKFAEAQLPGLQRNVREARAAADAQRG